MNVVVVGLGKIGLPLAVQCASRGLTVIGVDIDQQVVRLVNAGRSPVPGEPDLEARLERTHGDGRLRATVDAAEAVAQADVVLVVVPLVVGPAAEPDFGAIDAATDAIGGSLRAGTLVSYETTLPIGTTRQRFAPALAARSRLTVGGGLLLCHSPERVSSGTVFRDLRRYPKLVGGVDQASAEAAVAFYEAALDFDERPELSRPNGVWDLGSAEAAEMAKLAETTYRDVNIAFANELALIAERQGLDVASVIAASNSQPYSHIHQPGIAVGGHCIPVYPHFLLAAEPVPRLPAVARAVNASMPAHAVDLLEAELGPLAGRRIAVLGLAYRGGVREDAFSGAYDVLRALEARGAVASIHDPLYSRADLEGRGLTPYELGRECDGAIVQANHAEYAELGAADLPGVRCIVDGRRVLDPSRWVGVALRRIGAP